LQVWLARVVYMLEVIAESQENTEIPRCHKAHGRFLFAAQKQYWWDAYTK